MKNDILNRGYDALSKEFEKPEAQFRAKPFWSWNGELEEKELLRQVDVMKEMGFGGYFMHSRCGLITEYLGDEWFKLVNSVAKKGKETGMESWLYDEDRWPSGSAGGMVSKNPKYRMKSIFVYETGETSAVDNLISMYEARIFGENNELVEYKEIKPGDELTLTAQNADERVRVLKFAIVPDKPNSSYNESTYIDTMMREATDEFIKITHQQYKDRVAEGLWPEIRGIFADEPHRGKCFGNKNVDETGNMSCSIFYTNDIFEEFQKRYGYDVKPLLPILFYNAPAFEMEKIVKHDYIDLGCNLFNERFAMPINEWCQKNGIDFTGHVLHENTLMNQTAPNGSIMRFYENMAVPGIDILTAYDSPYWAAKQLQSSMRQTGKKWGLSELYGCTGWRFDFRGHKNVGDWQALFGINVRCPHLSWYTMEGEAKRDYPASILHQATYYPDYSYVEDYFSRFGVLLTEGKPVCDVLVINPIESVWLYAHCGWANWIFSNDSRVSKIEDDYSTTFRLFQSQQVDFDYADEQMLSRLGNVVKEGNSAAIKVGEASYKTVVIAGCETIRSSTLQMLRAFVLAGGKVVVLGDAPTLVDARPQGGIADGFIHAPFTKEGVAEYVKAGLEQKISLEAADNTGRIFCQIRDCQEDNAYVVALLNVDRDNGAKNVKVNFSGIDFAEAEEWCLEDGKKYFADLSKPIDFEPCEEHFFVLRTKATGGNAKLPKLPDYKKQAIKEGKLSGKFDYTLGEKNALALDRVSAKFTKNDGEALDFEGDVLRVDRKIRDSVGLEYRSGDSLQPWYIKKYTDNEYGKAELTYKFNIETMPEGEIVLCGERPEFIDYYVNGVKLVANGEFWIDCCLKTMVIPANVLVLGENTITAKTNFKASTNLEAVYIVGNFGVKSDILERNSGRNCGDRGLIYSYNKATITTLPEKLELGTITDQNLLLYTGTVSYKVTPEMIAEAVGNVEDGQRLICQIPNYVGSLVKITDFEGNNKQVLGWEPYIADITDYAKTGFLATLVCTRKNVFGPLHEFPAAEGSCGPANFMARNCSDDYVLMESCIGDIVLKKIEK